tara:strand:+ start:185 stop:571 length:387 start_codon:yes stop_codon:yes gene_type:complete
VGDEVSVNPVDDACLAGFPTHNDRHGSEEKERQPVPASRGYKHCRNEHRADGDLQAVIHIKLIPFLSLASARFGSLKVPELKAIATRMNLPGRSKAKRKADIVAFLVEHKAPMAPSYEQLLAFWVEHR